MKKNTEILYEKLDAKFPGAQIIVEDPQGDDNHLKVEVISALFQGKTLIAQHRMVTDALHGFLGTRLHALQIKTKSLDKTN